MSALDDIYQFWTDPNVFPSPEEWSLWKTSFREYVRVLPEVEPSANMTNDFCLKLFRVWLGSEGRSFYRFLNVQVTNFEDAIARLDKYWTRTNIPAARFTDHHVNIEQDHGGKILENLVVKHLVREESVSELQIPEEFISPLYSVVPETLKVETQPPVELFVPKVTDCITQYAQSFVECERCLLVPLKCDMILPNIGVLYSADSKVIHVDYEHSSMSSKWTSYDIVGTLPICDPTESFSNLEINQSLQNWKNTGLNLQHWRLPSLSDVRLYRAINAIKQPAELEFLHRKGGGNFAGLSSGSSTYLATVNRIIEPYHPP